MSRDPGDRAGRPARTPASRRGAPAFALAVTAMLIACGGEPRTVTPAVLARAPEAYDGQRVRVSGTLRTFASPRHYWIEDDALNRVAVEPHDGLAGLVDQRARVVGRFHYSRRAGRRIEAEQVTPLAGPGASAAVSQ